MHADLRKSFPIGSTVKHRDKISVRTAVVKENGGKKLTLQFIDSSAIEAFNWDEVRKTTYLFTKENDENVLISENAVNSCNIKAFSTLKSDRARRAEAKRVEKQLLKIARDVKELKDDSGNVVLEQIIRLYLWCAPKKCMYKGGKDIGAANFQKILLQKFNAERNRKGFQTLAPSTLKKYVKVLSCW